MNRRILLGVAGWLAVAATATAGTVAAIGVLEDGITGSVARPLDRDEVQRRLSRPGTEPQSTTAPLPSTAFPTAPPTTVPTTPPGTHSAAGDGAVTRVLAAGGGTVTARCAGGRATLLAWSPAQGFRADDLDRGPAPTVSLAFTSDEDEHEVTVRCGPDGPLAQVSKDDGHHGRGGRGGDD